MSLLRTQRERNTLADTLGETPETAKQAHLLRHGLADAYVIGLEPYFDGVIVQSHSLRHEPWCSGRDAAAVWALLRPLNDWGRLCMSPDVSAELAYSLTSLIEDDTDLKVRHYGDVYHTASGRVRSLAATGVRLLNIHDVGLLSAFRRSHRGTGFATLEDLLTEGVAAGAVVEGRLVALAHTNAITTRYGDISVSTQEAWRGLGFASASASIVARRVQDWGRTPVWSAGEGNAASLRVAAKLGFVEVSRRIFLNIPRG